MRAMFLAAVLLREAMGPTGRRGAQGFTLGKFGPRYFGTLMQSILVERVLSQRVRKLKMEICEVSSTTETSSILKNQ